MTPKISLVSLLFSATISAAWAADAGQSSKTDRFNQAAAKLFHKDYSFHAWDESDHTVDGEDWSLPPWVKAAPYSGVALNPNRVSADFPGRIQRSIAASWRETEPREGEFDFSRLRQRVLDLSENGKFAVKMGLEASVWETRYFRALGDPNVVRAEEGSAPRWLEDHGIQRVEEPPNRSAPFQVVNMDIYNPEYHKRYLRLVEEFGKSGIPQMKELDLCYLHLRSPSRGEEGSGPAPDDPNRKLYEERLQAWAKAFKGVEYKLCNVSGAEIDVELAQKLGMGQRNGFVEHYMLHAPNPLMGQTVDENGYLVVDESNPLIAENRASGDENEEYSNEVRFGPIETFPHRYHESMLRVLQMRRNFVWAESGRWFVNPPLLHYVALELGKNARTAPDAWCYLRESYVHKGSLKPWAVKNFERWLFQRDAEGARTEPAERVDIPKELFEFDPARRYEFTARKTQAAAGQSVIGFGVDESFLSGGPHPVAVKVAYMDQGGAEWALEYYASETETAARKATCADTGKERTVTFILKDAYFPRNGYTGQDLRIRALRGDAVIRFVRVIKLNAKDVEEPRARL